MKKIGNILAMVLLSTLLVLIRVYENTLFYDPFLQFFEMDYKVLPLPEVDVFALQTGVALRFLLNTIISLAIIWLVFKSMEFIKLSLLLYGVLFAVFFTAFSFIIFTSSESNGHFALFYVRRFLIQPLFLLILLPAFYFQKFKTR